MYSELPDTEMHYIILTTEPNTPIHYAASENEMIIGLNLNNYVDFSYTGMSHLFGQLRRHGVRNLRSGIFIVKLVTSVL